MTLPMANSVISAAHNLSDCFITFRQVNISIHWVPLSSVGPPVSMGIMCAALNVYGPFCFYHPLLGRYSLKDQYLLCEGAKAVGNRRVALVARSGCPRGRRRASSADSLFISSTLFD